MKQKAMTLLAGAMAFAVLTVFPGCQDPNAGTHGGKGRERNSKHYLRKYAEKEMQKKFADTPGTQVELGDVTRDGRNWRAEVIVGKDGVTERKIVVVDRKGRVISVRDGS